MEMNIKTGTYFNGEESANFKFCTNLSAFNKLLFVDSVVESIVNDKHYNSIVRDIIFDFNIVRVFTDIDTSFVKVKDDDGNSINPIIPIEDFLDKTNIVDIVKSNMEFGLLQELNDAVDKSIQYLTGIHPNPINDALANLISTIEKKVNEIDLDNMMEAAQKFVGMTEDFTLENAMNYFMNSDIHKKNLAEIEEAKRQRAEFANDMDKAIKLVAENNNK